MPMPSPATAQVVRTNIGPWENQAPTIAQMTPIKTGHENLKKCSRLDMSGNLLALASPCSLISMCGCDGNLGDAWRATIRFVEEIGDYEVDGERFRVTGAAGRYDYLWLTGPKGYGFGSQSNVPEVETREEHEQAIRSFLAQIDPNTGYIADD
jgi:hypothetical protein